MQPQPVTRRTFLRGSGVALALPMLEAFLPRQSWASEAAPPRRMVAICANLGFFAEDFFPRQAGRDYQATTYLDHLREYRQDFTVFSGVSHPEVDGGHASETSFLTAAPHPRASTFKNSISFDQYLAEQLQPDTRIPALTLTTQQRTLSWTDAGVQVPGENSPARLFQELFVEGDPHEVARQVQRLRMGRSVLDSVLEQTRRLNRDLGSPDRNKLDQYLTAVRDVEGRLLSAEKWTRRPKPKPGVRQPVDIASTSNLIGAARLLLDMSHLALQTDSTRIITLLMDGVQGGVTSIDGVNLGYHNLSHHGKDKEKLRQLRLVEQSHLQLLADFLGKLRGTQESGGNLLENTMVLFGSNLGNANSHDTKNMPMLLAGGGFRHGQHLAFDAQNNYPLCNLYVSMAQRLGLEVDRFASSTGTMTGMEMR